MKSICHSSGLASMTNLPALCPPPWYRAVVLRFKLFGIGMQRGLLS